MSKVSTNLSLDSKLKSESIALFSDLGMDLSTAVTIFLKQAVRVQGIPFAISRENPETIAALNEFYEMKRHPERYRKYSSFKDAIDEVMSDDV